MGVPMLFPQLVGMTIALIPVILVETAIARHVVPLTSGRVFKGVGLANIASTFLGIPAAWTAMFTLNIVTTGTDPHGLESATAIFKSVVLQASWLVPTGNEDEQNLVWMIPAASLVLLVPSFFISVFAEKLVLRRTWPDVQREKVRKTVWLLNGVSYAALVAFATYRLASSLETVVPLP